MTPKLVLQSDIARLLGLSGKRVGQLRRRPDFPQPVGRAGRNGQHPIWRHADVMRWAREQGREVRT